MTNRRLKELDYMRVVACIAVVMIHITAIGVTGYVGGSIHSKTVIFLNRSMQYATTLFIFLSGMTCYGSFEKLKGDFSLFLRKRLATILYPYVAICLVYYSVYVYMGYYAFDPVFLIKGILTGTLCYHLYFIIILVQMYLLIPVFCKLFEVFSDEFILAVVLAINIMTLRASFPLSDRVFFKYMFFFAAGIYVLRNYNNIIELLKRNHIKWLSLLIFVTTSLMYSYLYIVNSSNLIYAWFFHCVLAIPFLYLTGLFMVKRMKRFHNQINILGKSSYYIYLIHPLFLSLFVMIIEKTAIVSLTAKLLLYSVSVLTTSIVLSVVYVMFKDRNRRMAKLKKKISA